MFPTILLLLLVLVTACMIFRDGKTYFADFLKVLTVILVVLLAIFSGLIHLPH